MANKKTKLHEIFEKRMKDKGLRRHIDRYSEGKDDRRQDALIGVWRALLRDENATCRFLKNGAKFGINYGTRTKSVDSKCQTCAKKVITDIVRLNSLSADVAASYLQDNTSLPIDEIVSDKISFDRFVSCLTKLEKRFVRMRLLGFSRDEMYRKLKIGQSAFLRTRSNALAKFKVAFDSV